MHGLGIQSAHLQCMCCGLGRLADCMHVVSTLACKGGVHASVGAAVRFHPLLYVFCNNYRFASLYLA